MTAKIDIAIAADAWRTVSEAERIVSSSVGACEAKLSRVDDDAEISVVLCDDAEIRRLNRQWRGKDSATNVLSFPSPPGPGRQRHLGDIVIAFETVAREASEEAKTFGAHLAHMVVHGYLHLVGYDHENEADAEIMEGLEGEILAELGVEDPYNAPALDPTGRETVQLTK